MACGCSSGNTSRKSANGAVQDPLDMYVKEKFLAGVNIQFLSKREKELTVKAIKLPNIFVFAENPCVGVGEGLIVENGYLANCLTNFAAECYTVTVAPALVGTNWEVQVDGTWGTTTAGVTEFQFQTALGYDGCGTAEAAANLKIKVCAGVQNAANWAGAVYNRAPNTQPISEAVNVASGSPYLRQKEGTKKFRARVGDSIELAGTAIVGANKAVVLAVYSDGQILLDRDVTGISVTSDPITGACVRATAAARAIARFVFVAKCKCVMQAILDRSITSSESFPPGEPSEDGGMCGGQKYCFTITDSTPGAKVPVFAGIIELG
jgi:hypothetical protein